LTTAARPLTLIDAHSHTQPSVAATTAFMSNLEMPAAGEGTTDELILRMDEADIEWTMIVSFIPAQDRVARAVSQGEDRDQAVQAVLAEWHELNSWAAGAARRNPTRLKSVVGVDPVLMTPGQVADEIGAQLSVGASGVKIAPMFLGVPPDDEIMEVVWRLAVEHDVPVLSESGASSYGEHAAWGHPRHFESVLRSYPSLRLQLAHLGQGAEDDLARIVRHRENVITDTALRFGGLTGLPVDATAALDAIRRIGPEHVAFGTNYPIVDQRAYAAALRSVGLNETELRQVGHDNAARIWGTGRPSEA
jgi:predicted TIM-barrel fold metal-dependent hydrolase